MRFHSDRLGGLSVSGPGLLVLVLGLMPWRSIAADVRFGLEVRPILSDKCFTCHGPDDKSRKAKLRLDRPEPGHFQTRDGRTILAPGDPGHSELYRRVTSEDPEERMPPPETRLELTVAEKETIRRWIEQGARYTAHWAFEPLQAQVPDTIHDPWVRNPIDAFVLRRLRAEGLEPSPEASRETLLRRLSFDLTGLPPSLSALDTFVADTEPGAFERSVQAVLSDEAYGEAMAAGWMDVARYADTYGYQADVDRDMSPWRDWVIHAFNVNLPYDQFLLWQLAGDLLPGATRDQILATAFNRLHRQTNEGGSIDEEWRVEYVSDRVHTMGTAFLGLTLECARCHDHKYDPIAQRDYYSLTAFFDNIDESGLYSHFTRATPTPTLLLYKNGEEEMHRDLKERLREAERDLEQAAADAQPAFEAWLAGHPSLPELVAPVDAFPLDAVNGSTSPNSIQEKHPLQLSDGPEPQPGKAGQALRFSGDNAAVASGVGHFRRTDPFSISLWLKPAEPLERSVVLHASRAWSDSGSRGYQLLLEEGRPAVHLIHFWPGNAIGVRAKDALPMGAWTHFTLTYDGSSRAQGIGLYADGQRLPVDVIRDHLYKDIIHRAEWSDSDVGNIHLTLAGRFRDVGFKDGAIDEVRVFDRELSPVEVAVVAGRGDLVPERQAWLEHFLRTEDKGWAQARAKLQELRVMENDLVNDVWEIMVMEEMAAPRPTYLLNRGAYDARAERVEPDVPERIFPLNPSLPRNRLGLARWLLDPKHPLTSRVAVNRVWKTHFGRGLVPTPEDFGSQGQTPSHPELLDWLALWLVDHGWDLKALHTLIVSSATYRQQSHASMALLEKDPENRLLARGPSHRLSAEQIRDNALAVSGLLVRDVGGHSVMPYQPPGLWEESGTGKHYQQSKGEGLYRRSLYTFWKRTAPPPSMLTFDATSREVCTARREVTSTPLQSLVLLNDPQFVEAARVLAEHLVRTHGDHVSAALTELFRLATSRRPEPAEARVLERIYREQMDYFTSDPKAAEAYVGIGERPRDAALPQIPVAALTVVANAVMNHEEFVVQQ